MEAESLLPCSQEPANFEACVTFRNFFLRRGVVRPSLNPQAGGPPFVGRLRLFI
jgi:hypothetical protein